MTSGRAQSVGLAALWWLVQFFPHKWMKDHWSGLHRPEEGSKKGEGCKTFFFCPIYWKAISLPGCYHNNRLQTSGRRRRKTRRASQKVSLLATRHQALGRCHFQRNRGVGGVSKGERGRNDSPTDDRYKKLFVTFLLSQWAERHFVVQRVKGKGDHRCTALQSSTNATWNKNKTDWGQVNLM